MPTLKWSPADEAWTASLESDHFEDLEIRALTDGESTPPTEAQLRSVAIVERFAQIGLPSTKKLARHYALEYLGPEEVEDMEDEDLSVDVYAAIIPRLRETDDSYIIFVGNSDIDVEHGVAVLCKNGSAFAVTHSDIAYANHDWDDTAEIDQLFGG